MPPDRKRNIANRWAAFSLRAVRSSYFVDLCKTAFKRTDIDNSGDINRTELYIAVLYLYHIINIRIPGRNHKPPDFDVVKDLFEDNDLNRSGKLSEKEFIACCQELVVELVPRIVAQCIGSLVLAPFMGLLLYTLTKVCLIHLLPSWIANTFDYFPRALLTPIFASIFTACLLPMFVDAIESFYDRGLESVDSTSESMTHESISSTPTASSVNEFLKKSLSRVMDVSGRAPQELTKRNRG